MSLHAQCHQRIARSTAHRTVWRRRCIRHYASSTSSDPEWFQQLRTELLHRTPHYHREDLDLLHHEQLQTTLLGFAPKFAKTDADSIPNVSLAELLTRFNVRIPSPSLLNDGTDRLHYPGEPWTRRMWAGGAVKVNPELTARNEVPFRLKQRVACLERIKDVQLRGKGDQAKIFVKIERRFALRDFDQTNSDPVPDPVNRFKSSVNDNDWSDSSVKEERNLVFMRAKTAAELEKLEDTRYLSTPGNPVYSLPVTPTPSLLFRYSALTYNAHLIHLDSTYARSIEGHRNTLVHGPLTLTLMLQVLNKHLGLRQIGQGPQVVQSLEYRNFAPLYCNEEMRICIKHKRETSTGNSWDIWIEGPTSGMAVKATAHTTIRSAGAVFASHAMGSLPGVEARSSTLADAQAVRHEAQNVSTLHRREMQNPAQERPLWRRPEYTTTSRDWRKNWVGGALRYLYLGPSSALNIRNEVPRPGPPPPPAPNVERTSFSTVWRKAWVGKALPYLYLWKTSALINTVEGEPRPKKTTEGESKAQGAEGGALKIRRVASVAIRKTDVGLQETARRRAHGQSERQSGRRSGRRSADGGVLSALREGRVEGDESV